MLISCTIASWGLIFGSYWIWRLNLTVFVEVSKICIKAAVYSSKRKSMPLSTSLMSWSQLSLQSLFLKHAVCSNTYPLLWPDLQHVTSTCYSTCTSQNAFSKTIVKNAFKKSNVKCMTFGMKCFTNGIQIKSKCLFLKMAQLWLEANLVALWINRMRRRANVRKKTHYSL